METIKEIYFKQMSGDVFLSSAFGKVITPSTAVLGCFMFPVVVAEVCHALCLSSGPLQLEMCFGGEV